MSDKTIVSRNYILSWPIYCPPPYYPHPSARPLRLKCKYVWLDQEAHPIYTNPHRRFLMKTRFFSFPPKLPPPPQPLCRRTQLQPQLRASAHILTHIRTIHSYLYHKNVLLNTTTNPFTMWHCVVSTTYDRKYPLHTDPLKTHWSYHCNDGVR